jgi:hypothetical protein
VAAHVSQGRCADHSRLAILPTGAERAVVESAWGAVPGLLLARFPGRSPNPACLFPGTGLSTVSAVRRG